MGLEIGSLTRLPLGYVGESESRVIEIHVSSWLKEFPGSKVVVEVVRPDKKIYFAPTTLENGILRWTVGADEVMVAGRGYAQFAVLNVITNKEYRSRIVETIIAPSLDEFTKEELEASDPASKWANQVIAAAYAVQDVTGDLRNLNTQNKSNLVAAINEVRATGGGGSSGGTTIIGATIADGPVSQSTVWSSHYTNEILTPIKNDASKAVRFDKDQGLGEKEQEQARKNIGITSTGADVGSLIDNINISTDRAWSSYTTNNAIGALGQNLIGDIGQKSGLITDTNADLVRAINEVKQNVLDLAAGNTISANPIIEAWGDSLTYGTGVDNYDYSTAYPDVLSKDDYIGKDVVNYGAGGETIETIMGRMGAMPLVVMPTSTAGDGSSGGGSGGDPGGDSGGTSTSLAIIKQPASTKADVGDIVYFNVEATGVASYQWQYGTDIGGWLDFDVNAVATANTNELLLRVNDVYYEYNYRCVLTGANGDTLTTDTVRIRKKSEFTNTNYWTNQTPYTNPTTGSAAILTTYAYGGYFQFDSSVSSDYYCYLFSAEVEAGKTYLFANKNLQLNEWVTTNVRCIMFTSDLPYSYNSNANAAMFKATEVGTPVHNSQAPFTVPPGANYVSFLFSKNLYDQLAAAEWPMTMQEINDEHPGPSDTEDMSTASTLSVQDRASDSPGVLIIPGEVRETLLAGGIKSITGADTTLLFQPGREADGINPCFIDGVEGTLTAKQDSDEKWHYYFTRKFNGTPVSIIKPTPIITHYMRTVSNNRVLLLWLGQNNATSADSTSNIDDLAQRMIDAHKAIIDHVGTNKYIILGAPINQPVANSAEVYKPLYERMQYAFGKHYINIADYLIKYAMSNYGISDKSGLVGTENVWTSDAEDRSAYRVPTSLRGVKRNDDGTVKAPDSVHLNSAGYLAVADQVYKRGKELGYW